MNASDAAAAADASPMNDSSVAMAEFGYVNMFDWGFRFQWRWIGIGFETRWGSGKISNATLNVDEFRDVPYGTVEDISMNKSDNFDGKYTRKFAESRVYVDFAF